MGFTKHPQHPRVPLGAGCWDRVQVSNPELLINLLSMHNGRAQVPNYFSTTHRDGGGLHLDLGSN